MTGVGLCLPQLGAHASTEAVREFARSAEALGYTSLWVQDHFMYPLELERGYGGRPGRPMPQPYSSVLAPTELLGAVAAWTTTLKLGTSVLVAGHHWPVQLAQRLATLDLLSEGRLIVGLGVGWNAEEHTASGTEIGTRGRRMEDFIPALLACWEGDPVSYSGDVFEIPEALLNPKPIQRPHPPLISGMWSEAGLDRTARLFDGWNPAGLPVATTVEMVAAMNQDRPGELDPLSVYYRAFAQAPHESEAPADPISNLAATATECATAGFEEVIIEANFWGEMNSPGAWMDLPERCLPVLAAGQTA